ncbi:MAG TPA: carbohydrate-binding family 9-like protein [Verrucomicrobiae bacterium]|nr:carbohydrate-binding family 9-like protein [Verrucomicrobiae bacterium]
MTYLIERSEKVAELNTDWNDSFWRRAAVAQIDNFRPESSDHAPMTEVRLIASNDGLNGIFRVQDRYVRCIRSRYFDDVWKDSCVEFFVQPEPGGGYFNFEFNCGGAFLVCYVTDPTLVNGKFARAEKLPVELGQKIRVKSSLPSIVDPELTDPTVWTLQFFIPFAVLQHYTGIFSIQAGERWRGNFFKCATEVSHPHWASWSPVDEFNFHLPRCFGDLVFEDLLPNEADDRL